MKIVVIGGTGLIGAKTVAIRFCCRNCLSAITHSPDDILNFRNHTLEES
jgi:hypothetical protein